MSKTLKVLDINQKPSGASSATFSTVSYSGITRHDLLSNKSLPNQHPIDVTIGLQTALDVRLEKTGDTWSGPTGLDMGGFSITNLPEGTLDSDAVTVSQLDSAVSSNLTGTKERLYLGASTWLTDSIEDTDTEITVHVDHFSIDDYIIFQNEEVDDEVAKITNKVDSTYTLDRSGYFGTTPQDYPQFTTKVTRLFTTTETGYIVNQTSGSVDSPHQSLFLLDGTSNTWIASTGRLLEANSTFRANFPEWIEWDDEFGFAGNAVRAVEANLVSGRVEDSFDIRRRMHITGKILDSVDGEGNPIYLQTAAGLEAGSTAAGLGATVLNKEGAPWVGFVRPDSTTDDNAYVFIRDNAGEDVTSVNIEEDNTYEVTIGDWNISDTYTKFSHTQPWDTEDDRNTFTVHPNRREFVRIDAYRDPIDNQVYDHRIVAFYSEIDRGQAIAGKSDGFNGDNWQTASGISGYSWHGAGVVGAGGGIYGEEGIGVVGYSINGYGVLASSYDSTSAALYAVASGGGPAIEISGGIVNGGDERYTNLADATDDKDALNRQTGDARYILSSAGHDPVTLITNSLNYLSLLDQELTMDQISTNDIYNLAVTEAKIADNAVTTNKIASSAITESELGASAVTESKIDSSAVTESKLSTNSVTETKISDGEVTDAKLNDDYLYNTGSRVGATVSAQSFGTNGIATDVIAESTASAGVTVDGLLIKDGSLPEAAITEHEGAIDHDALTNFVGNEHIDWTQSGAGTIHADNYIGGLWSTATGGINYSGGKVGVGDSAPEYELSILTAASSDGGIKLNTASSGQKSFVKFRVGYSDRGFIYGDGTLNTLNLGRTLTSKAIVIDSADRVGINMTPIYDFDITGTTTRLYNSGAVSLNDIMTNSAGTLSTTLSSTGSVTMSSPGALVMAGTSYALIQSGSANPVYLRPSSSIVYIDDTASAQSNLYFGNPANDSYKRILLRSRHDSGGANDTSRSAWITLDAVGSLTIGNIISAQTGTLYTDQDIILTTSGDAGIRVGGTYAAPAKLHVSGGDSSVAYSNATISLGYTTAGTYPHFIHARHDAGATNSAIDFYTNDGTSAGVFPTNAVHAMTMRNGAVGVNDTTPNYTFDVNGDVRLGQSASDKVGLYGATPVVQASHITNPTDASSAITAINSILVVLENIGAIATS